MLANLHEWFMFDEGGVGAVRMKFRFFDAYVAAKNEW